MAGDSGQSKISGTSGSSGSNGTTGNIGSSGLSRTSGSSGSTGSSGISGNPGESGLSGTSGISGTSGSAGSNGNAGNSGTSGTSGDEFWVIASHSNVFSQPASNAGGIYYIGDKLCGWAGCDWSVIAKVNLETSPSTQLCPAYNNCSISNPHNLKTGDIIKLCGNSAIEDYGNQGLWWFVGYYKCSEGLNENDLYDVYPLFSGNEAYSGKENCNNIDYRYLCFNDTYTLPKDFSLDDCDVQLVVGFLVKQLTDESLVKVSWTFSVERPG